MKRTLLGLVVVGLALGWARSALADAAPPLPPPGESIQTGFVETKVQMVSENVLITIGEDDLAYIKATFNLRNQGTVEETFNVRFPIGAFDMYDTVNKVKNVAAYLDNEPAQIAVNNEPLVANCDRCPQIPWAHWPTTFPPGLTISIDVLYQTWPGANSPRVRYIYVLQTGAGWYGPIGEGTVTMHFPYEVNDSSIRFETILPKFYAVSGNDIVWHFANWEPDANVNLWVMRPSLWSAVVKARMNLEQSPNSAQAHYELAHALLAILYEERQPSEDQIAQVNSEYEAALRLDPGHELAREEYTLLKNNLDGVATVMARNDETRMTLSANAIATSVESSSTSAPRNNIINAIP